MSDERACERINEHCASANAADERQRGGDMSVSVRIPTILRSYTGGAPEVTTEPGTLREVIGSLDASYPGIGGRLLDDTGGLRRFVNVYVGEEDVRFAEGLDTPVPAGSQVSVIPAVAGG
jgi:sulfur-carrier protein